MVCARVLPVRPGARTTMLQHLDGGADFHRFRPFLPFLASARETSKTAGSDHGRQAMRDLRGVLRGDRQEGAEVEMTAAAGEVAEAAHVDERDVAAPASRHLRDRAAFHLDRLGSELAVQALPIVLGVDEAVAGQDGAEMDAGLAQADPDLGWQRLQLETDRRLSETRHQRLGFGIAGLPVVGAARGAAAGLDGEKVALAMRSVVVLDVMGANHDVAHAQRRIEAAGDAAQHQRAAAEPVEQQRGGDAGVHLACTGFDEHRLAAGDAAAPEAVAADRVRLPRLVRCSELVREMGELFRQSRYDAQKPACHGRMGYKVATPMSTTLPDRRALRDACTSLARDAAREIMRIYAGDLGT